MQLVYVACQQRNVVDVPQWVFKKSVLIFHWYVVTAIKKNCPEPIKIGMLNLVEKSIALKIKCD